MEFFTFSEEKRPVRSSEITRQFAYESLNHKYGMETKSVHSAILDDIEDFENKTLTEKYDCSINEIVKQAPIRICPNEKVSGAATFGLAIEHRVPATYKNDFLFFSVSHFTADFETVLKRGMAGIEEDVDNRLLDNTLTNEQREFLNSAKNSINAMKFWHKRYLDELKDKPGYENNYKNLLQVPFKPARTFYEAVQSIWFTFAFMRICGNWPGIGRLDVLLRDYLERDLENNILDIDEAREILAHFFIKGCEWITGDGDAFFGSGDAQHYQNIVIGGIDETGNEISNDVTYLILDMLEEFNIVDYPTTVRLGKNSPEKLVRRTAEVMKHGGGVIAIYDEDTIIDAMQNVGYSLEESRGFANDGCWEMQVPGKTNFAYIPFDGFSLLLNDTLHLNDEPAHFDSFEELKNEYYKVLEKHIHDVHYCKYFDDDGNPKFVKEDMRAWITMDTPCTVMSLFVQGCIEKATSYAMAGAKYYVKSPHFGGAADAGNSLRAIDKLCFIDKTISFDDFMQILKNNWEGEEPLRQYVLNKISFYGNDDDEADKYTVELIDTVADIILNHKTAKNCFFVPGVSTFGRQIQWRYDRPASPHGHRTGDVLAPNMGATPGSDTVGATALIRSYCKLDLKKQTTGAALDLKLLPSAVRGEDGTQALMALLRGFVKLGGCFMQPDVVDNSVLKEAQKHPEQYASLSVRVSGWNARFVTLNKAWQDMCIEKTEHGVM